MSVGSLFLIGAVIGTVIVIWAAGVDQRRAHDRAVRLAAEKRVRYGSNPAPTSQRKPIPDGVKMFVWQRDAGRCVKCGSNARLEFDHIIPVVMGGSDTARNLQLLCEICNRSKGGRL